MRGSCYSCAKETPYRSSYHGCSQEIVTWWLEGWKESRSLRQPEITGAQVERQKRPGSQELWTQDICPKEHRSKGRRPQEHGSQVFGSQVERTEDQACFFREKVER